MAHTIGPYKILRELGAGGFSTVFLAVKDSDGAQQVALKVLHPNLARNDNIVERFGQEAQAAANLGHHDNIVVIYETGGNDGVTPPFIAMEYINGGTLRDQLRENGHLPRDEAVYIIKLIGSALSHAHYHRIIHRDVNPKNILLDISQEPVRPVLTDFGIVKLLNIKDSHSLIRSTTIMGTYFYMAPEQFDKKLPTPATDIYALAITFFEMLSGERPFESDSPFELRDMHRDKQMPRLSSVASHIGPFFDNILEKATKKNPEDRYQHVTEFITAIEIADKAAQKYEILHKIAEGSFSNLYKAQHLETGNLVALKVLKSQVNVQQADRFRQEARIIAKLVHPRIIEIIDIADTNSDDQIFYMAMQFIDGGTLRDKLETSPLPRDEAVYIVKCIGEALTVAHKYPIIHRDIKPENILFDTSQEKLQPILTDFGAIKVLSPEDSQPPIVTATGYMIGSEYYMAPEQWGSEFKLTKATDVYALAIVFFEMLAGRHPFEAKSVFEFMDKQLKEAAPLLSSVQAEIGTFFDDVLIKALDKEPSNRYQTVADFIQAIEEANVQAEEVELGRKREQADEIVKAVEKYLGVSHYEPEIVLKMLDDALSLYPKHPEALRLKGRIHVRRDELAEALNAYKLAYQEISDPFSPLGQEYLPLLKHVANTAWEASNFPEAAEYYQDIWQIVGQTDNAADSSIKEISKHTQERLTEYYNLQGTEAYADGEPDNLDQAVEQLTAVVQALDVLHVPGASDDLKGKLNELQEIVTDNRNYDEIRLLMHEERHEEARNLLESVFIRQGKYNRPEIALLLWMLVYYEEHNEYPISDIDIFQLEPLIDYAIDGEQTRIAFLTVTLKPWANASDMIEYERGSHSRYSDKLATIEERLNDLQETLKDIPDLNELRQEVARAKDRLQDWFDCLKHIEENVLPHKINGWLKQIDTIDADLRKYPLEGEVIEMVQQITEQLDTIEGDPLYTHLQMLPFVALQAKRAINDAQTLIVDLLNQEVERLSGGHRLVQFLIPLIAFSALIIGGIAGTLLNFGAQQLRFLFVPYIIVALIYVIGYILYYIYYKQPPGRNEE